MQFVAHFGVSQIRHTVSATLHREGRHIHHRRIHCWAIWPSFVELDNCVALFFHPNIRAQSTQVRFEEKKRGNKAKPPPERNAERFGVYRRNTTKERLHWVMHATAIASNFQVNNILIRIKLTLRRNAWLGPHGKWRAFSPHLDQHACKWTDLVHQIMRHKNSKIRIKVLKQQQPTSQLPTNESRIDNRVEESDT